jgi:hypothetical protein
MPNVDVGAHVDRKELAARWIPATSAGMTVGGWPRRVLLFLGLSIAALSRFSSPVAALSENDLLGNWCGNESNYSFTRKVMVVTRPSSSDKLVFDIVGIEPRDGRIAVSWQRADGKVVRTEFADFSSDGKKMVQLPNSGGPRREFRRC